MATSPFDINKFLKGQPVVTVNGKAITNLRELRLGEEATYLAALVDDKPAIWDLTGKYLNTVTPALNLLMSEPVIFKWAVTETLLDIDPLNDKEYTKVIMI